MNSSPRRNFIPLIAIAAGFLLLTALMVLLFGANHRKETDTVILSFHEEQRDTTSALSIPTFTLSADAPVIYFTILIPHTSLLQTRYAVSLLIPPADHASIPNLQRSNKSSGTDPDTLRIALDRSYFTKPSGKYLFILNEIVLEDSHGKQPLIFFYPFNLSAPK